ncbi:hypothetical protein DPMN_192585 [Dreissena polymorpha]|uniref:Uncharacterized protein n=1 Tax=Dreissena polymorpha TaxID=45954 RepID=A0A9D4BGZ1_DREPO|nr:hypothetical protein DPMN_192585 [Dreissena polymorpha]
MDLMPKATRVAPVQPAHPRSLIRSYPVRFDDFMAASVALDKTSKLRWLEFELHWPLTVRDTFSRDAGKISVDIFVLVEVTFFLNNLNDDYADFVKKLLCDLRGTDINRAMFA